MMQRVYRFVYRRRDTKPLIPYLPARIPRCSERHARTLVRRRLVAVNDRPATLSSTLGYGDRVEATVPWDFFHAPARLALDIVFEDDVFLAVNKPAGLVVHPSRGHKKKTLYNGLLHRFRKECEKRGGAAFWIINRIDKDTSGLVLVAKRKCAAREISKLFEARKIKKTYRAVVSGRGAFTRTKIAVSLAIDHADGEKVKALRGGRWKAVTRFRYEKALHAGFHLLTVTPLTGKSHQIRAHLAYAGFPIVGDVVYGGVMSCAAPRCRFGRALLHAAGLAFNYRGIRYRLHADPPADFTRAVSALSRT